MQLESQDDLSITYTPGVARPCEEIAKNPGAAWDLTWKGRTIAPTHGGINLEDFSAPRCFAIEEQLQDQHPRPARRSAWYGHRSARHGKPHSRSCPRKPLQEGPAIVGTGRDDFPNQVNNVLASAGLFRGALYRKHELAAVDAITSCREEPSPRRILPLAFDRSVAVPVAQVVRDAALAALAAKVCDDHRP